jgi:hypothetical protein
LVKEIQEQQDHKETKVLLVQQDLKEVEMARVDLRDQLVLQEHREGQLDHKDLKESKDQLDRHQVEEGLV